MRSQNLDRDGAVQARVTRTVHLAHAAGTEGRDNLVGPEFGARHECHGFNSAAQSITRVKLDELSPT